MSAVYGEDQRSTRLRYDHKYGGSQFGQFCAQDSDGSSSTKNEI
jgi:hypothetical protein